MLVASEPRGHAPRRAVTAPLSYAAAFVATLALLSGPARAVTVRAAETDLRSATRSTCGRPPTARCTWCSTAAACSPIPVSRCTAASTAEPPGRSCSRSATPTTSPPPTGSCVATNSRWCMPPPTVPSCTPSCTTTRNCGSGAWCAARRRTARRSGAASTRRWMSMPWAPSGVPSSRATARPTTPTSGLSIAWAAARSGPTPASSSARPTTAPSSAAPGRCAPPTASA